MARSVGGKSAAKHLAELLKEFARQEAERERQSLEKIRSAKIKKLFGKHLEPHQDGAMRNKPDRLEPT
jgi:hypothetical protein